MSLVESRYKTELQNWLGTDVNINFFWKGRVALYAILKALGIKPGDEVILPGFTCIVVPNVIIYLGAKPVYVDINEKTFNIDESKIEAKITSRTKVILAQNTFGQSANLNAIMNIALRHNLFVVEDCAHGFGGKYAGQPNGTIAHAAFFSTQWSKPFSTGIGGIAVTKNQMLGEKITAIHDIAAAPSFKEINILKALIGAHRHFLNPVTYSLLIKIYRVLSRLNLVIGSSKNEELEGTVLPENFLKKMSITQMKEGIRALQKLKSRIRHRQLISKKYDEMLSEFQYEPCLQTPIAEHSFLRYPLLVADKNLFLKETARRNIECGDWFISPIHPVVTDFKKWFYTPGENPIAEKICSKIVNLPTHEKIEAKYINRLSKLFKELNARGIK